LPDGPDVVEHTHLAAANKEDEGSDKVYLIDTWDGINWMRRWIPNMETFRKMNFKESTIVRMPGVSLKQYPQGPAFK
jgi:hypothetical protein